MWNVQHMAVLMVKAIPPKEVVKSSIIQPVQGIDETICKILNMNMNQSNTLPINSLLSVFGSILLRINSLLLLGVCYLFTT